ncbi:MAG: DegT/DnrJ/EryC1/StrS family aminotransferase [Armatimonadota bacterium]
MNHYLSRRGLLGAASACAAGLGLARRAGADEKLAVLGGTPVRKEGFPGWPIVRENEERAWMAVLQGKAWFRFSGNNVSRFEERWAKQLGAGHALAVTSGTTALFTSLKALGIGPGDEVIVPPYTFIATVNAVLLQHALPVFVDSDPETFQIDARKIEAAITPRTACILPVHLGGGAADLDTILAVGKKHRLPVLEDACQSHLAEWRGKKVGTLGDLGCFSFQASKNLNSGEGGAVVTSNKELYERCFAVHNQGFVPRGGSISPAEGCNLRMTEFQGALLLEQMTRLEEQSRVREQNAAYLTAQLKEIPGIRPARMYEGCTRNAYHLYMFRYDPQGFAGVPRARFLQALQAEGVPCSGGYTPLNRQPFLKNTLESRAFKAVYSPERLREHAERNRTPENDRLCEEAVWLAQTMLLGSRRDMDQIAEAVRKIQKQAASLK